MIIFNYKNLYKRFGPEILYYAQKINIEDYEDDAQYIKIYIWKHIYKFDPTKSSLRYYVHLMVLTGFRKAIFDKTKQAQFEDSFCNIMEDVPLESQKINYPLLLEKTISKLSTEEEIVVFYAIVYNHGKNYSEIAKLLKMNYSSFVWHIKIIRSKIEDILKESY